MNTKRYLALVLALVMAFSLVVPVSAAPSVGLLVHSGNDTHDTARLTVYVDNAYVDNAYVDNYDAAVGSIDSDMNAKLVLKYCEIKGDSTVTVAGQTESQANKTTFTLNGNDSSGINLDGTHFPGFTRLGGTEHAIWFVDELGESSNNYWDYTFVKSADTDSGVTLELVANDSDEADAYWQILKDEAFRVNHEHNGDSFIELAAGSYLQMDTEKLTVNSDLLLDDFSTSDSVDANVTNARAKLTYTNNSTTAYQLLLKQGTKFALGNSIAEVVNQDLLVTMSNVTKGYGEDSILGSVYTNLDKTTETQLAQNLLKVFSEIAGLARPYDTTDNKPVVITFGTPTTSTSSTIATDTDTGTQTVEKTTTTFVTNNDVAGTTNTTTVSTETVTNKSTVDAVTTTQVISKVTETSSTVEEVASENENELAYTVTNSGTTTTTTTTFVDGVLQEGGTQQTDPLPVAVKNVTVSTDLEDSNKNLSAIGATAKVATPALDSVADEALAAIVTKAITDAQTGDSVDSISVKIVVEAKAITVDNGTKKTYEVTPKAYTYENMNSTPASEEIITNAELATDAQFSITLPVPDDMVNEGKIINVTHRSINGNETFQAPVLGSAGAYYVTFTVTHFSEFDLEPVVVAVTGTATVAANLTLEDDIAINFHVWNLDQPASYYSAHYSFNGETEKVVPLSSITPVDGEYSITVASCAAKQMADVVHFELYCGDTSIDSYDYSIRNYCLNKINNSSNASLVALCRAVLNYGASAQSYFSYKVDQLANDGISTSSLEDVPADYNNIFVNVSSGINPLANMTLVSKTELNFELDGLDTTHLGSVVVRDVTDSNAVTVIDEARLVKEEGTNYYAVKVKGIPAKYLNHVFELSYEYFGTQETVRYSPMTYAYRNQNKTTYGLGNLCRAMYGYWQAAAAYLPNN